MKIARFTHANNLQPVYVDLDLIFSWYYSAAGKATHLVASGGAMLPILETAEQVSERKAVVAKSATAEPSLITIKKEEQNG